MARPKKNTNTQALADKMRKAVLQAAIEGKLTDQREDDGNARDLLIQIEAEKQRLIKAGEIKRQKSLPDITEEEQPFGIPDNWEWVRLGDLCLKVSSGSTPAGGKAVYKEKGVSFIRSQNVHNDGLVLDNVAFIDEATHKKKPNGAIFAKDILLNITGASIGRACIVPDDFDVGNTNQHVLTLRQFEPRIRYFVHTVLISPFIFKSIMDVQVGGTKEGLSASKAKELMIPLPPLAEQQRIVRKLKEVLAQIDSLQTDEDELHRLQLAFPNQMQASLLQAAIEGKLTQQDATKDGYASDLLTDIEIEKQKLIKAGEIKRSKTLPPISEEEKPFDIPDNWEWVRLGELITSTESGKSPKCEKTPVKDDEWGVLTTTSVQKNYFLQRENKILPKKFDLNISMKVKEGDLLITRAGPSNRTGVACVVKNIIYNLILSDKIVRLNYLSDLTNPSYLMFFLNSSLGSSQTLQFASGMDKQQVNLSQDKIKNFLIPIPPLAEQQRIVDLLEQALPEIQTLKEI